MNPTPSVTPRSRWSLVWKILLAGSAVWAIAVAMLAVEVLSLSRPAGNLRDEMLAAVGQRAHRQIQLTVGPGLLAGANTALAFVPDAPAEARDAIGAVHHASVGVYDLTSDVTPADRRAMFEAAERAMSGRGWTRIVGVNQNHETVAIYAPTEADSASSQRVCVAVCQNRQLVVVEGVVDGDALLKLAGRFHPPFVVN